jgi:hypothetical protein
MEERETLRSRVAKPENCFLLFIDCLFNNAFTTLEYITNFVDLSPLTSIRLATQ